MHNDNWCKVQEITRSCGMHKQCGAPHIFGESLKKNHFNIFNKVLFFWRSHNHVKNSMSHFVIELSKEAFLKKKTNSCKSYIVAPKNELWTSKCKTVYCIYNNNKGNIAVNILAQDYFGCLDEGNMTWPSDLNRCMITDVKHILGH